MAKRRTSDVLRDEILSYNGTWPRSAGSVIESLKLVERGLLIGLPVNGFYKMLYPSWQFGSDGQLLPGLAEILGMTPKNDPWGIADILTSPQEIFCGKTPIEMLTSGKVSDVVEKTIKLLRRTYE